MKFILLISVFLTVTLVKGHDEDEVNCHCSVVISGDDKIFVRYRSSLMSHVHDCTDSDGCSLKCIDMMNSATNNGDLNSKPDELKGYTVGDFGCRLLGMDVDVGVGYVYSKVCDQKNVKTSYEFKSHFCCRKKKHQENCSANFF